MGQRSRLAYPDLGREGRRFESCRPDLKSSLWSFFYLHMFHLYILESETSGRLYIGQTNDLQDRIHRHNSNQNLSTKNKGPWKLLFSAGFESRSEAVLLERKLKS